VDSVQQTDSDRLSEEPGASRLDLLERDSELAAVRGVIAPSGLARLLAIEGPPGIGKTSLIREARHLGQEAGMRVLRARGSELEACFSFGVVRQLFEPLLAEPGVKHRSDLLSGAAALALPLFDAAQLAADTPADASLPMLHGLYWLTANAAAAQPLLVTVDDLHWCDPPSLRWLAYLLARLDGLDVSIVVGLRPMEPSEAPAILAHIVSDPQVSVLRPAPLTPPAVARLVRETVSGEADDAFCAACHEITGGNPLLVRELDRVIAAERLAPTVDNVSRLHELAARAGSRALSGRLSRLPPEATRLAQAIAVLGDDVDTRQAAVLANVDDATASAAAAALSRVGVLRPQPPLGFVHPLLRRAVYETLTPLERAGAHARAAQLLADGGADPERVAAHELHVPPAPEDQSGRVVAVLRQAALNARRRGAPESAAAYLTRALAEGPPDPERAELLLELGSAEALVRGDAAVEHLKAAHELISDPIRRAKTAVLLGRQLFFLHRVDESIGVFGRGLEELGDADGELRRLLEVGVVNNALFEPARYHEAIAPLEQIRGEVTTAASAGEKMLLALLAYHEARAGSPLSVAVPLARRALSDETLLRAENGGGPFVCAAIVLTMADLNEALALYDAALSEAHSRGSIFAFAAAKVFRAQALVLRGDLAEAEADGREALDACEAWGIVRTRLADGAGFLADALMEQGRLDEAAAVLARSERDASTSESAHMHFLLDSRARLLLLRGDAAGGLAAMLDADRRLHAVGGANPAFIPSRSLAALAWLELGEPEQARRLAVEELELARKWGAPRALGAALRVSGLVEGGAQGIELLEEAVSVLCDSPAKLEHARARTDLGAALRRANRRKDAREQLRRGIELATICGAAPLVARAETELLATGARPRRVALSGLESLTPSELRVAEMAAEGPTNREIAQALFVTPKTVEVHLSSVYRKLEISSRAQLRAALARAAGV
jgi:DNA-binding CsgD family transcriptional regulator/tetratricopeptide (TPR) repeat protein